ncbi:hypothetical protein C5S39_10805 [Candidatus Methanophagaceae archaeon]|nr:hypothetical protein C5S39_10805 [Methanophagales archaeon]
MQRDEQVYVHSASSVVNEVCRGEKEKVGL